MLDKLTKNRESEYKQHEGEKEKLNEKNMKLEEEKAGIIFEKNKEIGNINDVVNQLTIKLKGKESEIANLA